MGAWGSSYGTSKKVAGSSPDKVDFFNLPNPSSHTMALGSTQSLTEMSTRNLPGVKGGRRVSLTTPPPSLSRLSRKNMGSSTSHNPMGLHGLLQWQLYFIFRSTKWFLSSMRLDEYCLPMCLSFFSLASSSPSVHFTSLIYRTTL
jgi:hypothetical protein